MDDFHLYFRFKNGDMKAFEILYDRYAPSLYRYLMKLLWNEDDSRDILQETFLRLYRSSLIERGKLSAWLFKVATNQAYRTLLRRKKYSSIEEAQAKGRIDPVADEKESNLRSDIDHALGLLPEPQRTVVLLKFNEGFRYREISEILGCPLGTVKSRMHHALLSLRKILVVEKEKM